MHRSANRAIYIYNDVITSVADLVSLRSHLKILHISSLVQWDVMVFMHTHGTSLASTEHVARLIGYDQATVGGALDSLRSAGLIHRSGYSRRVHLYRLASVAESDPRSISLRELLLIASERKGRLLLIRTMGPIEKSPFPT